MLAIQHLLGLLATLFQHETNKYPAFTGLILGQWWIVWTELKFIFIKVNPGFFSFMITVFKQLPLDSKQQHLLLSLLLQNKYFIAISLIIRKAADHGLSTDLLSVLLQNAKF